MSLKVTEEKLVNFFKKASLPMARFSLFVIFFWFGILKVAGESPASGVVARLFENTIPFMSFDTFLVCFGLFECLIGILFMIKGLERIAIPLLFIHMVTTFGPLIFLPSETWSSFLVPTLEGQYIIKNLVIIAAAINIGSHLEPKEN
jgi:uncharacterized membrane protein YkgB